MPPELEKRVQLLNAGANLSEAYAVNGMSKCMDLTQISLVLRP